MRFDHSVTVRFWADSGLSAHDHKAAVRHSGRNVQTLHSFSGTHFRTDFIPPDQWSRRQAKTAFALMSVRDPVYGASMSYLPSMGGRAVALAKQILLGAPFKKDIIEPTYVITADNVAKYVNDGY